MRSWIGLNFGTLKGLIKANLSTKFGRNPMNIHGVMTDYLRKIRSKVCHAHRVNRLKESAENCYVDGVTIVRAVLGVTRYLCNALHNIITFVVTK